MTVTITREFGFDMGHCLPDHEGACHNAHGHRYRFDVTVSGPLHEQGSERGMVVDFGNVKQVVNEYIIEWLDHRFAMSRFDPRIDAAVDAFGEDNIVAMHHPPTAEHLAATIASTLAFAFNSEAFQLTVESVTVWETPTCSATWTP